MCNHSNFQNANPKGAFDIEEVCTTNLSML